MADEKKDDKKGGAPKGGGKKPDKGGGKSDKGGGGFSGVGGATAGTEEELWRVLEYGLIILLAVFLAYKAVLAIWFGLQSYVIHHFAEDSFWRRLLADPSMRNLRRLAETSALGNFLYGLLIYGKYLLFGVAGVFIGISVHFYRKIIALTTGEELAFSAPPAGYVEEDDPAKKRWKRIVEYVQSDNPSNWRLAILEADIILDEILDINGYRGDTVGDKLKFVEASDVKTLDQAWEAHKIRNAIAHQGETFTLTEREARRVIGLYEQVFKEFNFI